MPIAFFDSGIGGLNVLKEALKILSGWNYIYYADSENAPYGTRPKEEVRNLVNRAVETLVQMKIEALVVACNTATSVSIDYLRQKYSFPVIGMEPAVKPAIEAASGKKVLVTATPLTLKEDKFIRLIDRLDQKHQAEYLPLPDLVGFAENGVFESDAVLDYLKKALSEYDLNQFNSIVLGCTHFCFFQNAFRQIIPSSVQLIDGNSGTVQHLKRVLEERNIIRRETGSIEIFISGKKADLQTERRFLQLLNR